MKLFSHFDASRILSDDGELLVVNKPAGISSQASDPNEPDDLASRLKRYLAERGDSDSYLGIHQRLDRETSGVLLYTRKPSANPSVAKQFEGRRLKKTYVAAVTRWRGPEKTTLTGFLRDGKDGTVQVHSRGAPKERAVTHVKVLERRGERALLELELETGRTHQARVQLAHAGSPIAGDSLYGGPIAARLLLHARALKLEHAGRWQAFDAPLPGEFRRWFERGDIGAEVYDDRSAMTERLQLASERRYGLAHRSEARKTTAFRLINEAGDGFPGLAVDYYDGFGVAQFYDDEEIWRDPARKGRVLDALVELGLRGIYVKQRPKQANTLVETRREDIAPKLPLRGEAAPDEFAIWEEGVPYLVRLGDGLSTGIFLDQRENRRRIRELSGGRSVLNLFSYTCGFSMAAAAGGALKTVSVDASLSALEWGRKNLSEYLPTGQHSFVGDDAFRWLARMEKKNERFDVVIVDPPSYSKAKSKRFVASDDFGSLIQAVARVVNPGGRDLGVDESPKDFGIRIPKGAISRASRRSPGARADKRFAVSCGLPPADATGIAPEIGTNSALMDRL